MPGGRAHPRLRRETPGNGRRNRRGRAHPHSRGENASFGRGTPLATGSSPLTRGKQAASRGCCATARLIPAHTGKTPPSTGSSPLTRGKHHGTDRRRARRGLIPAHAGKTHPRARLVRLSWAHPRSRGENVTGVMQTIGEVGSSPLTRGKRSTAATSSPKARLIPTHAGKTDLVRDLHGWSLAHPHSRGENRAFWRFVSVVPGSSPLTRGKLGGSPLAHLPCRLIPAHAGKTCSRRSAPPMRAAHPHSRGETRFRGS